ncbi:MAG: transcriptional regulator, partial [Tepidiformaceae bacterium]
HLGFVEIGRSAPSRELVQDLAAALNVPLRERNRLLEAAGYLPVYAETPWTTLETEPAGQALLLMLKNHEPLPAVAMDRHWDVVAANRPARALVSLFCAEPPAGRVNFLQLIFDPDGLRPAVSNWDEVAPMLIHRVHHEALGGRDDPAARELLARLLAFPGVPERFRRPRLEQATPPVFPVVFGEGRATLSFFSAVTTLGTAQDITLQELRIEFFLPADDETRERCETLLAPPPRA